MDKLPDKIVDIDVLRINRNINKRCQCTEKKFVVDPQNRAVYCGTCGAWVDPYDAILELATRPEKLRDQIKGLLEQAREIRSYKPHLRVIKRLEQQYRGRKMLPTCPHCHQAFYLEELTFWTNAEFEKRRRERIESHNNTPAVGDSDRPR